MSFLPRKTTAFMTIPRGNWRATATARGSLRNRVRAPNALARARGIPRRPRKTPQRLHRARLDLDDCRQLLLAASLPLFLTGGRDGSGSTSAVSGSRNFLARWPRMRRPAGGRPRANDRLPWLRHALMPWFRVEVLPPLPDEVQYRLVGRDLVLFDVDLGLVIDVLRNALPMVAAARR